MNAPHEENCTRLNHLCFFDELSSRRKMLEILICNRIHLVLLDLCIKPKHGKLQGHRVVIFHKGID